MAFSKVIFNGDTLMDDTGNTAASNNMLSGVKAQGADGVDVTGAVVTAPASDTNPAMDGTASAGSASTYSRGDHVHPSDTSKLGTSGNASSTTVAFTMASSRTNIATGGTLATAFSRISKWLNDLGSLAFKSSVAKTDLASGVQASLDLADSALQSYTETDPTVPSWAKASSKPSYTASEVGAQATITESGILKGDGAGGVTAATAGTDYAAASHSHGNLTSGGDITATAPTIANGDQIIINDNSASKITNGPTFDGSTTTKALTPKGTWETFLTSHQSLSGYVPTSRTVNSKALSADITLTASDVGALPDSTTIPSASTTNPSMDGTASYGSGTSYARSNHVHPTDTSRQAKITASGMLKGDGSGGVSAATAGTDYAAASHTHSNYAAKTTITTGTLTATSWSGSTYSALQTSYPAASYDIEIEPDGDSCTAAQYAAWGAAQLVGSATTNVLTALGTVPTVNIPIVIKVTAK